MLAVQRDQRKKQHCKMSLEVSFVHFMASHCPALRSLISVEISFLELKIILFLSKTGLAWVCKWTTGGSLLAYQGHGIPEWKNEAKYFHFFINKNGHVLDLVDWKHLIPKGAIETIKGKKVYFTDGTEAEVDTIIQSTGYIPEFSYLPSNYADVPLDKLYKFLFNTKDPSIAFVGFVRPIIGSIPGIAEIQCRWMAKVFSGKVELAHKEEVLKECLADQEFWKNYFKDSSRRVTTLVEAYTYVDDIAKKGGFYPDFMKLLRENPRGWATAVFSPYNACQMRLNDIKHQEEHLKLLRKHGRGTSTSPLQYFMLTFLRLIWFDWILDRLGDVKCSIQRSRWWKSVREYKIVQTLDWYWQAPKRWLFDTKTRI